MDGKNFRDLKVWQLGMYRRWMKADSMQQSIRISASMKWIGANWNAD